MKKNIIMILKLLVILLFILPLRCSKFDYLLFENFELTKRTFIEEKIIFQNARKLKHILNVKFRGIDTNICDIPNTLQKFTHKYEQLRLYNTLLYRPTITKLKVVYNCITYSSLMKKKIRKYSFEIPLLKK